MATSDSRKYTFFWSNGSPFSQFHKATFTVDGITYNCAEQYMMHQKAGRYIAEQLKLKFEPLMIEKYHSIPFFF